MQSDHLHLDRDIPHIAEIITLFAIISEQLKHYYGHFTKCPSHHDACGHKVDDPCATSSSKEQLFLVMIPVKRTICRL
jgi:hypothetical protein